MRLCTWRKACCKLALGLWVSFAANVLAAEPLDTVKAAVQRAMQVLKDPNLKAPEKKTERIARLKEILNP
ncbi:MAG TPA: hypothetical protein VF452_22290, partial [Candidatus Binatia bacterium]